jgi:hypothetical protein
MDSLTEETKEVLLTLDGKGKEAKQAALEFLLKQAYDQGWYDCQMRYAGTD